MADNSALGVGGSGGGLLLANLSSRIWLAGQGTGLPFAFTSDGSAVECRGSGDIRDLRVAVFAVTNGTQSETLKVLQGSDEISDGEYSFLDPLALIMAISRDGEIMLTYSNYGFYVTAVRTADGAVLARMEAPAMPAFSPPNDTPEVSATRLPLFFPMVADTDFNNRLTYGGWGLSSAVGPNRLFASTFHHALEYDIDGASFRELDGCNSGVSAMVYADSTGLVHLAKFTGIGLSFRIFTYEPATARCAPHSWVGSEPAFKQIRALGVSDDGSFLYVAEAYSYITELTEMQLIKAVDLRTGAVKALQEKTGAPLVLDSVVAIRPLQGGAHRMDLSVLTAPGGFLGGPIGETPISWEVYTISVGQLQLTNCDLEGNSASHFGGALAALDSCVIQMESCIMAENSAAAGGGLALSVDAVGNITKSTIERNSATWGGGAFSEINARLLLSNSSLSQNSATLCGAVGSTSTEVIILGRSVRFDSNNATNAGGVICVMPDQAEICHNDRNRFMVSLEPGASPVLMDNTAANSGGAFYDDCQGRGKAIPFALLRSCSASKLQVPDISLIDGAIIQWALNSSDWVMRGNTANYGSLMATLADKVIVCSNQSGQVLLTYYPGQILDIVLAMTDG